MTASNANTKDPKKSTKKSDLLRRIGGPSCLESASMSLSARIKLDQRLTEVFSGFDVLQLTTHHTEFLSVALAETRGSRFDVEAFVIDQHTKFFEKGMNEAHFEIVLQHFLSVLNDCQPDEEVVADAVEVLGSYQKLFNESERRRRLGNTCDDKFGDRDTTDRIRKERVGRSRSGEGLLAMFQTKTKKRNKISTEKP
jgi:truncated hemoglobin YjbI